MSRLGAHLPVTLSNLRMSPVGSQWTGRLSADHIVPQICMVFLRRPILVLQNDAAVLHVLSNIEAIQNDNCSKPSVLGVLYGLPCLTTLLFLLNNLSHWWALATDEKLPTRTGDGFETSQPLPKNSSKLLRCAIASTYCIHMQSS